MIVLELQRQYPHPQKIGTVNPLETLDDDRPYSKQPGSLGGPVAGRAGAVFLARYHHQRGSFIGVFHRRVEDRHFLVVGDVPGYPAFGAGGHLVADANVGECPAHHYLVVAPA